jgi:hypothetical protein
MGFFAVVGGRGVVGVVIMGHEWHCGSGEDIAVIQYGE